MKCKICQSLTNQFGQAEVLKKYNVSYYRCDKCGFIQTESPHWLDEAYSSSITKSDIGLLGRNLQTAGLTKLVILTCFNPGGRFLDYGGGYGIFVRLMRDSGFDYYRYDPLCLNLFADGFDAVPNSSYDL